jgi:LuxR family maltose regulon positive regulatory protein
MLMRGKFKEAEDISQQSLRLAIKNGIVQTGIVGSLYANLGIIFCEWNDLDKGIRLINKGIERSIQGRDPVTLASCRMGLLRAYLFRKDFEGAFKMMQIINDSASDFILPPWITNTISALNIFFWLASGNLKKALQLTDARRLRIDNKLDNLNEIEHIALAHVLIAQKRLEDADLLLQRLIENAKAGDHVYVMIEMRLMRALIFKAKADTAAALRELTLALSLAEPGGLIRIFISMGKPVAELLEEIIEVKKKNHDEPITSFSLAYAKRLLTVFKAGTPAKIEGLMDPISDRELEVLHLIAAGLSNREIAEKLFISLNTVKTHTKNINSKLNVNSRIKAIARAKELGLFL